MLVFAASVVIASSPMTSLVVLRLQAIPGAQIFCLFGSIEFHNSVCLMTHFHFRLERSSKFIWNGVPRETEDIAALSAAVNSYCS